MSDGRPIIEVDGSMIEAAVEVMQKMWIEPPNTPIELAAEAIIRAALSASSQVWPDRNYVKAFVRET